MLADTADTACLCRARCGLDSLSPNTSRMVRDAVPDRSRAAPPDQGVFVTDAYGPNAYPSEQSEVSSIYFMPIRYIFSPFVAVSLVSCRSVFRSVFILLQGFPCGMS